MELHLEECLAVLAGVIWLERDWSYRLQTWTWHILPTQPWDSLKKVFRLRSEFRLLFLSASIFPSLTISRAALLLLGLRGSAHGSLQNAPTLLDQRVIRKCKAGKRNLFFLRPKKAFSWLYVNLLFSNNNSQKNPTNTAGVPWSTWNEATGYIQTHPN